MSSSSVLAISSFPQFSKRKIRMQRRGEENRLSRSELEDSFGSRGSMFPSLFGGKDPFDEPFFTRPSCSLFGSRMFPNDGPSISLHTRKAKEPLIEELLSDDELELGENEEDDVNDSGWANRNPLVEHPDDDDADEKNNSSKKELIHKTDNRAEVAQPQTKCVSFKRVSYGGIDGTYYTATTTRRTGNDGVTMEESRQADKTTGQATHTVSRGIQDKGHSVTRKLDSDGKVDTMQTLHNLDEDELVHFEQTWKGKSDMRSHSSNDTDEFSGSRGSRWPVNLGAFADPFRDDIGGQIDACRSQAKSTAKPKKTIRINIE